MKVRLWTGWDRAGRRPKHALASFRRLKRHGMIPHSFPGPNEALLFSHDRSTPLPLKLKDPAGKNRDSVLDMLKKICPEANLQVADDGTVSTKDADFCTKQRETPLPNACKCVCAAIGTGKTISIEVKDDVSAGKGGRTGVAKPNDAFNGTGSDVTIEIENKNRWRLDKKDKDDWIDDPDWIILAHELCGHAVPDSKGTHPECRPGKPGYKPDWHNDSVKKENEVRSDRGLPERPMDAHVVQK